MPLFLPNLGFQEILLLFLVALLVFGPKKLPEIGRSLGRTFREFKRSTSGFMDEVNRDASREPTPPSRPTRSVTSGSPPSPQPEADANPIPEREIASEIANAPAPIQPTVIRMDDEESSRDG